MLKKILFSLGAVASCSLALLQAPAQGQNVPFRKYCATDSMTAASMKQNPDYARQRQEFMKYVRSINQQNVAKLSSTPQHTIPIVVHIIHTYGSDNITDAQVHDAVRIINEDFQKKHADTASIIPAFQPLNANVGFRFRLAKKDPNGNCTNGITRTYSTLTNNANDNVKSLVRWDPSKYLNIWVVSKISFGAGGYSYLPCGVPPAQEGIVILSTQFGSIGRSNGGNFSSRSLTHEIGHYMGLPHTWGGSNTPGDPANCTLDDGIFDTPNTIGSAVGGCSVTSNTCPIDKTQPDPDGTMPDNVQNYMDYSACGSMFTTGQKAVMVGALSMTCRSNLSTAANLLATGTNDGYVAPVCAPSPDFRASADRVCEGSQISFSDQSYNITGGTNVTYNWTFPGGTPATSTLQNPVVTYATPGNYDVILSTTSTGGTNSVTKQNIITVKPATSAEVAPYQNSFESANFPIDPTNPGKSWEIIKPGTLGWEQTAAAAATGTYSLRIRNNNIAANTVNTLISPAINATTISGGSLKFKVGYAQKTSTSADKLVVSFSKDCGMTWIIRSNKAGALLSSNGGAVVTSFVPNASQWRQESVNIPSGYYVSNLLVRFEATSDQGNAIFLDDIEITGMVLGTSEAQEAAAFSVYPNPSHGNATVSFNLPSPTNYAVEVVTLTGQRVGTLKEARNQEGKKELTLSEITGTVLSPGVYLVKLQANGFTAVKKAVVY